jgi:hypothetical protein
MDIGGHAMPDQALAGAAMLAKADIHWLPNECQLSFFCFRRVFSQNREGHFCELC